MVKKEKKRAAQIVPTMLVGGAIALVISMLILLMCSAGVLCGWFRLRFGRQLGMISCALGGFAGSLYAVRKCNRYPLPVGIGTGALCFLLLLLPATFLLNGPVFGTGILPALLTCICSGALAGFAGRKRKKRRLA